ncbi:hypothetical protein [uncultured Tateyamaria sp.]|nr:hypothetical protein [uncultured Tateyamaria sp.]
MTITDERGTATSCVAGTIYANLIGLDAASTTPAFLANIAAVPIK